MNIDDLRKLERTGGHLFHGTTDIVEGPFKPRQAYTFLKGIKQKDGEPAVYASPDLNLAIFMATVNPKNAPNNFHSRFYRDDKGINFLMNEDTKKQMKPDSVGYIYVFNKNDFTKRSQIEYLSYKEVEPVYGGFAEVKFEDLDTLVGSI